MKSRTLTCITAITFFALALPLQLAAQHTRYKLIDLGTFGGPASNLAPTSNGGPENPARALTNNGVIVGQAATATPDPTCSDPDCFFNHAYRWQDGQLSDLGTLQGFNSALSSVATWINNHGWIVGGSQTGAIDPLTGFFTAHAVLWTNGEITDLGTLGGDLSEAFGVNNRGQVVGFSLNGLPDPVSIFGNTIQSRAFLWQNGVMKDLGTLCEAAGVCGLDAQGTVINASGHIAGFSSTNETPNATTSVPTVRPFLWRKGKMIDLGTLGGTLSAVDGPAVVLNNRDQVAGTSTLAGDVGCLTGRCQFYHPFLWEDGVMKDLGTLGGDTGFVSSITDSGDLIGTADLPGPSGSQIRHAFLWRNGVKTDLGSLGGNSHAEGINSQGQIVGRSTPIGSPVRHAFLWEHGGPMVDLNTLIPANSSLLLEEGGNINDRGEIAGRGLPPGCDDVDACGHAFLLVPCDSDASCENKADVATETTQQTTALNNKISTTSTQAPLTPMPFMSAWRARLAQRLHVVGFTGSRD
jgi:probable HAF family extracellular repeat protein